MKGLNKWAILLFVLTLTGCEVPQDNNQQGGSSSGFQPLQPQDLGKRGPDGSMANFVHIDLADAKALVTLQKTDKIVSSGLALSLPHGVLQKAASSDSKSPLFKILQDQSVKEAIRNFSKEAVDAFSEKDSAGLDQENLKRLPHISYMAVNAYDEVFVVFEHSFIFRDVAEVKGQKVKIQDYQDPWSPGSPFTCGFFKVNQKLKDYAHADQIQRSNLQCITYSLEMNTWDPRAGLIQFDDAGNLYFTAHVPGNWKNVLVKRDRLSGALAEVINANIQFRDYLVTKLGGVIYTGQTSTDGKDTGGGSSFFRFVTPSGELKEIVRDWWDYTFQPITKGTYNGQIIFYGPNTLTSTIPGWDSACVYRFDPGKNDDPSTTTVDERSTRVATCQNDMGRYANGPNLTSAQRKSRCEEDTYYLGSGQRPKDILLANVDTSDDADEIVYIGNVQHKLPGEWFCDVCIKENQAHCLDANNKIIGIGACTGSGTTTTVANRVCYNGVTAAAVCSSTNTNVERGHEDCRQPGTAWTQEIGGMALIDKNAVISLLSKVGEEVVKSWVINGALYYSSYATGVYSLKKVTLDSNKLPVIVSLLTNIEVYKLTQDPVDKNKLFINGLNFKDNSFVAGSFDPSASSPQATLSTRSELTGVIDTILIFQ